MTYIHTHTCTDACVPELVRIDVCTHAHTHTYTHAHTRTHRHAHEHTHTHIHVQVSSPSFESLCLTTNLDMPGLRLGLVAMFVYSRYVKKASRLHITANLDGLC